MGSNKLYMVRKKDTSNFLRGYGDDLVNQLNGRIFKKLGHVRLSPLSRQLFKTMDKNGKKVVMFDPTFEVVEFELMETNIITIKELFNAKRR